MKATSGAQHSIFLVFNLCITVYLFICVHVWRLDHKLQRSVFSFYHVSPGIKLRSAVLVASTFTPEPRCLPCLVFWDALLLAWNLPVRLHWLAKKPSACFCLRILRLEAHVNTLAFFTWALGLELRSSCFYSKHFSNKAISPALLFCWNRVSHSPGCPRISCVSEHDFELLILLPPLIEF